MRVETDPRRKRLTIQLFGLVYVFFPVAMIPCTAIAQTSPATSTSPSGDTYNGGDVEEQVDLDDDDSLDDIGLLELEIPMVVSATRRAQKITSLPYAISVITAEDIRKSGARSMADALRLAVGVDVAEITYGNVGLSPRGFQGFLTDQLLVLVDGRQIFDTVFAGTSWGCWPFQLEDIERIEIIRGPGGVTWGANAVAGFINIVTKDPRNQLGMTLRIGGGSRGTHREYFGYAMEDKKLRLRISTEYESSDGFSRGGSFLLGTEDEYHAAKLSFSAIYEHSPTDTLTFSGGSLVMWDGFPAPLAAMPNPAKSESQSEYLMVKWTRELEDDGMFELVAYVNDFHLKPGIPSIDYRYQQIAIQVQHSLRLGQNHWLSWGIDHRTDLLDTTNSDPFAIKSDFLATAITGVYANDQWTLAPNWMLDLGARIDYENYGGFHPSGRAALSYTPTEHAMFYGAISRAFQMPSVGARHLFAPVWGGILWMDANQEIDTQDVIAYEIGYRDRFFDRLDTSATVYWHEYTNLSTFSPVLGPPGLFKFLYDSRGKASAYGMEFDWRFAATEKLTLLGNYSFEHINWRASAPYTDQDAISPPEHKFMVGARYDVTDDLRVSSHLYYVDETEASDPHIPFFTSEIDSYFRLDLWAEHEFWDDRASVAFGVKNLTDPHHREGTTMFLNSSEVPRTVFAEFRLAIR